MKLHSLKRLQYFLIAETKTKNNQSTGFIRFYRDERRLTLDGIIMKRVSWANVRPWARSVIPSTIYEFGARPKLIYAKSVQDVIKG